MEIFIIVFISVLTDITVKYAQKQDVICGKKPMTE
jgi:hypothetical protein